MRDTYSTQETRKKVKTVKVKNGARKGLKRKKMQENETSRDMGTSTNDHFTVS